jgi:RNA polymerase sigma-70 factor (ECF subfamily)
MEVLTAGGSARVQAARQDSLGYRAMGGSARAGSELDTLLRQVADGDVDAFAQLYDQTRARVFGLVFRVLRDRGYSEETTQEIYLQLWRNAGAYDPAAGSAVAWILSLAHRRAVDRVRVEQAATDRESRYGARDVERDRDVVADANLARDERDRVVRCLEGLTAAQRQCIELAYYQGLTYAQVSAQLAQNPSTIKSRMRDALSKLRRCLDVP